jgi:hypothetical protein
MGRKMRRGKQQILFNYLPGKTFDFERIGTIARVASIRGIPKTDLNQRLILRAIEDIACAWSEDYRPLLQQLDQNPSRFILLEPRGAQAQMFPLFFWCQNRSCGRVHDRSDGNLPNQPRCSVCRKGQLVQLRFVRVHRCGALQPLSPPFCKKCHSAAQMALDTRGSERISGFQWTCQGCGGTHALFGGRCRECTWPAPNLRNMDIEVHRAGRTFYSHYVVLLNQPGQEMNVLLSLQEWPMLAASAFLELPEMRGHRLVDFAQSLSNSTAQQTFALSTQEIDELKVRGFSQEQIEQFREMQAQLQNSRSQAQQASSPVGIAQALVQRTSISEQVWRNAGQEMLEAVMPLQSGTVQELFSVTGGIPLAHDRQSAVTAAKGLGLSRLTLVSDFPITTATFGYSRVDYQPDQCRLNPFPPDQDHQGKFPIFVDMVQADALMMRLDAKRVGAWLARNGYPLPLASTSTDLTQQAYFVTLFDRVPLRQTLHADRSQARLVFGLLHTLSHLSVRKAALLCGLDRTSLSEYVLPRALTFALYCNHRFGATIGALVSLFEQSVTEWLRQVHTATRRCVYDPVCSDHTGSCHACTHLAETSCRFFNLNLGRAFLFGGRDPELGEIKVGYLDPSLP